MPPAISAEGLSKCYELGGAPAPTLVVEALRERIGRRGAASQRGAGPREIWALRDVSLEVPAGQAIGVVGRNGSGKTTLLKVLARITEPTSGTARIRGTVGALLDVVAGFHPELTGRENVFLSGAILGMSRHDLRRRLDEIVDFAGIDRFLDTPVKRYSSGMRVRLAFSVAAHLDPDILLVDEVLAVGDAAFRRKCTERIERLYADGRTIMLVSHDLRAVEAVCERVVWLHEGRLVADGPPAAVTAAYLAETGAGGRAEWAMPSNRAAAGPVWCRRIRLVGGDGIPRASFATFEPVSVEFEIDVAETVLGLRVGFELVTLDGIIVCEAFHDEGLDAEDAVLGEGRWLVRATLPAGILNHRTYAIHARILDRGRQWFLREPNVLRFEIAAGGEADAPRAGLLALAPAWEAESASGARASSR